MKALRSKSLMSLIYAVLLALPLCAILSRVIYVQSNKNAYQSYYGETINETKSIYYEDNDNLAINTTTYFTSDRTTELVNTQINIELDNFKVISSSFDLSTRIVEDDVSMLIIMNNGTSNPFLRFMNGSSIMYDLSIVNYTLLFKFDTLNNANVYNYGEHFYINEYNKYSYLDNVFEYSVSQFVSENDFGQLNFFQWYDELLLSNNSHNALYIHFANWYLNYAMLISLMQILFLVLMWFVNFARKLLDRGMNYDW